MGIGKAEKMPRINISWWLSKKALGEVLNTTLWQPFANIINTFILVSRFAEGFRGLFHAEGTQVFIEGVFR